MRAHGGVAFINPVILGTASQPTQMVYNSISILDPSLIKQESKVKVSAAKESIVKSVKNVLNKNPSKKSNVKLFYSLGVSILLLEAPM